jgi:hypothetical protein
MNKILFPAATILCAAISFTSCKKDETPIIDPTAVKDYTVPTTYTFSNVDYTKARQAVLMVVEVDAYLKIANAGSTLVALDQNKVNNMFSNTGNPFTVADLNSAGLNITGLTSDAALYKSYADSVVMFNTGTAASQGVGGFVPRGSNKIIVGPNGVEHGQAFVKGTMGALLFKEAVRLLTGVKTMATADTVAAQKAWDDAFGYFAVPANYDSSVTYASTDVNKPLLWGGYLAERGKSIQAGGTMFQAFLKGRAAIGGYDITVRNAQADIILEKWEQLAAAAALHYVTAPTASSAIGNLGTQFHALSEGFGFIAAFKYRPSNSKLSNADFQTLNNIIHKDFYVLINQPGFTDLVTAQNILKNTYGL